MAKYYSLPGSTDFFPGNSVGYTPFDVTISVTAAQLTLVEVFNVGKFPADAYLVDANAWTLAASAVDTHATPVVDLDLQVSANEDGSSGDVLIESSPVGIDAIGTTVDVLDDAAAEAWLDLGSKWLQIVVDAAPATAAAGTIRIKGVFARGLNPYTLDLTGVSGTTI